MTTVHTQSEEAKGRYVKGLKKERERENKSEQLNLLCRVQNYRRKEFQLT